MGRTNLKASGRSVEIQELPPSSQLEDKPMEEEEEELLDLDDAESLGQGIPQDVIGLEPDGLEKFKTQLLPLTLSTLHELLMVVDLGNIGETSYQKGWGGKLLMAMAKHLHKCQDPLLWKTLFESNLLDNKSSGAISKQSSEVGKGKKSAVSSNKLSWYGIMRDVLAVYMPGRSDNQIGTSSSAVKRRAHRRIAGKTSDADLPSCVFGDVICGFIAKLYFSQSGDGYKTTIETAQEVLGEAIWDGYQCILKLLPTLFEQKLTLSNADLIKMYPRALTADSDSKAVYEAHYDVDKADVISKPILRSQSKTKIPKEVGNSSSKLNVSMGSTEPVWFNVEEEIAHYTNQKNLLVDQKKNLKQQLQKAEKKLEDNALKLKDANDRKKKQEVDCSITTKLRKALPEEDFEETSKVAVKTATQLYSAYVKVEKNPTKTGYKLFCDKVLETVEKNRSSENLSDSSGASNNEMPKSSPFKEPYPKKAVLAARDILLAGSQASKRGYPDDDPHTPAKMQKLSQDSEDIEEVLISESEDGETSDEEKEEDKPKSGDEGSDNEESRDD